MKAHIPQIFWHGDRNRIMSIDFFPNSEYLISSGADEEDKLFLKYWHIKRDSGAHKQEASLFERNILGKEKKETPEVTANFLYNLSGVHTGTVNVARFSPNGKYLATASDDSALVIWTQRWKEEFGTTEKKLGWASEKVLRGHTADVYDLSWGMDSKHLVSCSIDGSAILFSVEKGKGIQRFEGHRKFVQGVALDPLMKYIVTLSTDTTARIYKLAKSKTQNLQYFINHVVKVRAYEETPRPIEGEVDMDDSSQAISKQHRLFADENECPSFMRRIDWSPDGSLCLLPSGLFKSTHAAKTLFTVYGFIRTNMKRPAFHLPGFDTCPICVRFCPLVFAKMPPQPHYTQLINLKYRYVFAIASITEVAIYCTQSTYPLAIIRNIHYASLTDLTWSGDKYLGISSSDGYCSFITFEEGQLGEKVLPEEIEDEQLRSRLKEYMEVKPNDISNFTTMPQLKPLIKSAKDKTKIITVIPIKQGEQPKEEEAKMV